MRTFDFSPLWRSTIGFDHLADLLDSNLQQSADDNYPPYNVERCGEDRLSDFAGGCRLSAWTT